MAVDNGEKMFDYIIHTPLHPSQHMWINSTINIGSVWLRQQDVLVVQQYFKQEIAEVPGHGSYSRVQWLEVMDGATAHLHFPNN